MQNDLIKLEYNKILEKISNLCKTYIGKEITKKLRPLNQKEEVEKALKETNEAVIIIQRSSTPPMSEIENIDKYIKILEGQGTVGIKALLDISVILQTAENLKEYFYKDYIDISNFTILDDYFKGLYTNTSILEKISKSIIDENNLADNASNVLQTIRRKQRKLEQDIRLKLNNFIHSSSYSKYIRENIITIRNGRFVIPVKEEYRANIKGFVHDISSSGSTIFIEPIAIFELNNELSNLNIEENIEIEKILQNLSSMLYPYTEELKRDVEIIGKLDFIFAKAKYSLETHSVQPKINDEKYIKLINARHPLISTDTVVPISLELGKDFSSLIITGPNTGGKTVTLKTIGILSAMACSGLNILADENSSIFVFDHIYADIGDEQSIAESLSTFSAHMSHIVKITKQATQKSLILLDELGSGTDPLEGANLAISILEYFNNIGALTVSTSHYQELKKYALVTKGFKNASVEFDIENLKPTYKLLVGIPGKSNAFAISRKLGLDEEIIQKASSYLNDTDINLEDLLKNIYDNKIKIEQEKEQTSKYLEEISKLKEELSSKNETVKKQEKELITKAKLEARQILIDAKETANDIIKEMSNSSNSEANKLRNKLNEAIDNTKLQDKKENIEASIDRKDIKPNTRVYLPDMDAEGEIVSNISKDDKVMVQVGFMKMSVPITKLQKSKNKKKQTKDFSYTKISSKARNVSPELNVIGYTVDEAIFAIDKYLDDCFLAKLSPVRIVHGKGTGALRNGIHKYLKNNKYVDSYRLGTFGEGEMGVTVVNLKI